MLLVIHHAELPGCHSLYRLFGMYCVSTVTPFFELCFVVFRCMTYLEAHVFHLHGQCEEVKVGYLEVPTVSRCRLKALAHVEYISLHVFSDSIPRAAAEAKSPDCLFVWH